MIPRRTIPLAWAALLLACAPAWADFTPISSPDAAYLAGTHLLPVTAPDFDVVSSLTDGFTTVSFDADLVALTVPTTWSTWGSPPDTETATPRVLWTNGLTSLELTLTIPVHLFGLEAQPNTATISSITASFFSGADLLGEITRDVDGFAGARLFAASSTTLFDRVVISSFDDFAIAQVRLVPEPSSVSLLVAGLGLALAGRARRALRRR